MISFLSKKSLYILLFLLALAIGIFLRSYNFSEWMHFELDQARDSLIISNAYENGAGELTLLGPRARGTFFRMGPIFYYFEYISAKIFGNTPPMMAYSVLFFSSLSLPLFYFFCRRYFGKKISLTLLFLFSVSIFLVVYSRFGWNPNPLPFFALLSFYSLLRACDTEERKKGIWLIISFFSITVASQLHSLSLIGFPIVAISFLAIKRPRINFKYWIAGILIAIFLYVPVFINEFKTGGDNVKEFWKAISGNSENNGGSILKKTVVNYLENSRSYLLVISGKDASGFLKNSSDGTRSINIPTDNVEDKKNIIDMSLSLSGILLFSLGILLCAYKMRRERDRRKRDFIIMVSVWLSVFFAIFIPITFDLSLRFFLLVAPLPFILLGMIIKFLNKFKWGLYFSVAIVALLFISNFLEIKNRFFELANADSKLIASNDDYILKEKARVTYGQEKKIVDYMVSFQEKNKYPIYYKSDPQYAPAFEYFLKERKVKFDGFSKKNIYEEGNYFLIKLSRVSEDVITGEYQLKYEIAEKKQFGTLTVFVLKPLPKAITAVAQDFDAPKKKVRSGIPVRYKWNEIFGSDSSDDDEEDGE